MGPAALPDPIAVPVEFTGILDHLGVPYFVGSSLASSIHSFNVIHMNAAVKVDLCVSGKDEFNEGRLPHRQRVEISDDPPGSIYQVDTAEHPVLWKLE